MLAEKLVSDEDFIAAFKRLGSPEAVSKATGLGIRTVYRKRKDLLEKHGVELESFAAHQKNKKIMTIIPDDRRVILHAVENGMVFIASDCHYWPDQVTTAHRAFVELIKEYKPKTIILNGDVFDGAQVSRHPPLMGTVTPTPKQEIEACQDRLDEIASASKNARKFWTFGNHDTRLFSRLAANSPELVEMVSLFDHFPGWQTCWRVDINENTVVKHRWHNGIHATYNNALKAGKTLITGHLHKLQSVGYSDYNGRRWGVDTGTLAEPYGDQFTYTECNPVNWASGFVVLTFKDGFLLPPELCEVLNGVAYFRGQEVCRGH
jgi:predicted phosphodiesterase